MITTKPLRLWKNCPLNQGIHLEEHLWLTLPMVSHRLLRLPGFANEPTQMVLREEPSTGVEGSGASSEPFMGGNPDVPPHDFRVPSGPWLLLWIPEPRLPNHESTLLGLKALRLDEPEPISTDEEVICGGVIGESIGADEGKLSDILENLAPTEAADSNSGAVGDLPVRPRFVQTVGFEGISAARSPCAALDFSPWRRRTPKLVKASTELVVVANADSKTRPISSSAWSRILALFQYSEESVGVVDGSEGKGFWWAFIRA
ncbi:hypothetical protein ARMSODRAFT_976368 [Armillaria solidipes]|uniref:Uncharacterized protein n=1 Tax=Armillaria solidipes TaxID=1076256 RepID=A0A2H3BW25_9AGAR|nr:hypothetical protein ARMSODRAFT_976368 [Armillaria solidipes]